MRNDVVDNAKEYIKRYLIENKITNTEWNAIKVPIDTLYAIQKGNVVIKEEIPFEGKSKDISKN